MMVHRRRSRSCEDPAASRYDSLHRDGVGRRQRAGGHHASRHARFSGARAPRHAVDPVPRVRPPLEELLDGSRCPPATTQLPLPVLFVRLQHAAQESARSCASRRRQRSASRRHSHELLSAARIRPPTASTAPAQSVRYIGPLHRSVTLARYIGPLHRSVTLTRYIGPLHRSVTSARFVGPFHGAVTWCRYMVPFHRSVSARTREEHRERQQRRRRHRVGGVIRVVVAVEPLVVELQQRVEHHEDHQPPAPPRLESKPDGWAISGVKILAFLRVAREKVDHVEGSPRESDEAGVREETGEHLQGVDVTDVTDVTRTSRTLWIGGVDGEGM